ncbi:MAG: hypothetical protein JWN48_1768 [Myxococcaceae bacterium]|nr:hypothetical protein [Myxococcaceae bacterium]
MPAPVLAHNLRLTEAMAPSGLTAASFGRGLYARKVALDARPLGAEQGPEGAIEPARMRRTVLRWQHPLRYLIVWQRRDITLTWHAPWCRRCDCPGAGWRFERDGGYVSGLGFELSFARE